jgi:hypothetical protein
VSGDLVPIGDVEALADALIRAWEGTSTWCNGNFKSPGILKEFDRQVAASRLITFVEHLQERKRTASTT